jgi:hypothetical protein
MSHRITVNGEPHVVDTAPDTPLPYVLRNDLGSGGTRSSPCCGGAREMTQTGLSRRRFAQSLGIVVASFALASRAARCRASVRPCQLQLSCQQDMLSHEQFGRIENYTLRS